MQISIVSIGNSKGIILPQSLIKQCGFKGTIEIEVINHNLLLKASRQPRQGWEELFALEKQPSEIDNREIMALQNKWDEEEWEW